MCPECGAEGLDGAFSIVGGPRLGRGVLYALLGFLGLGLGLALVGIALRVGNSPTMLVGGVVRPNRQSPPPEFGDFLILAALGFPFLAVAWSLWKSRSTPLRKSIVWTFHPRGVEIRSGALREFIPHAEVVQIGAAKDLFASMSQLTLVRRHARLGRVASTSRVLYIRGSHEERDARVGAARRWLEDQRRAAVE